MSQSNNCERCKVNNWEYILKIVHSTTNEEWNIKICKGCSETLKMAASPREWFLAPA